MRRAAAARPPFPMSLTGLGAFDSWDRPRVVWLGAGEGAAELGLLAGAVRGELSSAGFPTEERPFKAHLTLCRLKTPPSPPEVERLRQAASPWEAPEAWAGSRARVGELVLMESRLAPEGARYRPVSRVELG